MNHFLHYIKSSPPRIFVFSFILLIIIGTLLLLLPFSTTNGISIINSLFTSTSAVCVTGLIVVDTSSYFTYFGKIIIMLLIQSGALGILTFSSYLAFFFKGTATYKDQITLSNIGITHNLSNVFKTLKRTLIITLLIEVTGAVWIYFSLNSQLFNSMHEQVFFSLFHSISAFCNAGFSTLPNGVMEAGFVNNYLFQLGLIVLIILGGMGFSIVINLLKYLKHLLRLLYGLCTSKKDLHRAWILSLDSKINLWTIAILIVGGTFFILINEYDNVLSSHNSIGKLISALFTATTPRTAGFNTINFSELHLSSIIVIIILMWIGASPASTGGGIKTSTFAIAILNCLNLVRGGHFINIFKRRIANSSIQRAFAVIILSLFVITCGIILISFFDKNLKLLDITFECFSAYSTVGLSLGITPIISTASKIVLILLMFIGRVTMLTILIALFKKNSVANYEYPSDEILIN